MLKFLLYVVVACVASCVDEHPSARPPIEGRYYAEPPSKRSDFDEWLRIDLVEHAAGEGEFCAFRETLLGIQTRHADIVCGRWSLDASGDIVLWPNRVSVRSGVDASKHSRPVVLSRHGDALRTPKAVMRPRHLGGDLVYRRAPGTYKVQLLWR